MSLAWRVRRLRAMSPGEVAARGRRAARHGVDALTYEIAPRQWRRHWTPGGRELDPASGADSPLGVLTPERARTVREHDPDAVSRLLADADEIVAGKRRYFGYPEVTLSTPIAFDRDPFTKREWPRTHAKRIDYRSAEFGDPKWIWELNRLQELPLLAAASLLAEDERYVAHALELVRGWLSSSEPGRGIAWSNGFEAGIRAISLAVFLDALRGSPLARTEDVRAIFESLWQHARWIDRDPSTHSSANNHLLGELVGLAAIGLLTPEIRSREHVLARALVGLSTEAGRQIAADGTSVEQAFRYHVFVVDLLLLVVALLDAQGREVPTAISDALHRSARALAAQLGVADPEPTYGDADDAFVLRLSGTERRDARDVCAALAARLGESSARLAARRVDAMTCWLFGDASAATFAATLPDNAPNSTLLEDAGLAILRREGRRVLFDVGPLGYLSTAAHGHADALQVTVSDVGEDLVVDPGVGSYFGDARVRAWFRGTGAHATVRVDGRDQSEAGGPFLWSTHAAVQLLEFDPEQRRVAAEHYGYRRLRDPVRHRRCVVDHARGPVVIVDRVDATAAHALELVWPLHPNLEASAEGASVHVSRDRRPRLLIAVRATVPGRFDIARGERDPFRGWYSRRLEHLEPTSFAVWSTSVDRPVDVATLLWPIRDGVWPPDPELELIARASDLEVRYVTQGERRTLVVSLVLAADVGDPVGSGHAQVRALRRSERRRRLADRRAPDS